jgi:hypothetical protein
MHGEFQKFTRVAVENQIIFHQSKMLYDIVDSNALVQALPPTSEDNPLFLVTESDSDWRTIKFKRPSLRMYAQVFLCIDVFSEMRRLLLVAVIYSLHGINTQKCLFTYFQYLSH